jgi:hypothetical protein
MQLTQSGGVAILDRTTFLRLIMTTIAQSVASSITSELAKATFPTLGQTLANNIVEQQRNAMSPEEQAERKRQARVRELNEIGMAFFAKAKQYFTDGILSNTPMDLLYLQVGGEGYKHADDYHNDVNAEIDWHMVNGRRNWATGGKVPTSMTDPDRFAASWEEFHSWATSNELEAYWQLGRGGVGGWWYLRIKPTTRATSA